MRLSLIPCGQIFVNLSTNILWYQDYLTQENLKLEKWENSKSTPVGKWFLVKVNLKKVYPPTNDK